MIRVLEKKSHADAVIVLRPFGLPADFPEYPEIDPDHPFTAHRTARISHD